MHIGLWNYYEELNSPDKMFDPSSYNLGYGLEQPFVQLRDLAKAKGSRVEPFHEASSSPWDAVVFFDYPSRSPQLVAHLKEKGVPTYLVVLESVLHNPDNARPELREQFHRVLTWSTKEADGRKVVHSPIPQDLTPVRSPVPWEKKKLSCLIAGNKESSHPMALYRERIRLIRWFEENAPQDFDLYGFGWETAENLAPEWLRKPLQSVQWEWKRPFPSFRGTVADKRTLMAEYRFSFCLENIKGNHGYVTEKIFDGMLSGNVPIYQGAPDIHKLIPDGCYLDLGRFGSVRTLYKRMSEMTEHEHAQILQEQSRFLASPAGREFSAQRFAERIWNLLA